MDFFATDDQLAALERALAASARDEGATRLALAWHLVERDTARALQLAAQAEGAFTASDHPVPPRARLIRGYADWLFAHLDDAERVAAGVLAECEADAQLEADVHWLLGWVASDRGDSTRFHAEMAACAAAALSVGDSVRAGVADAAQARMEVLRDLHSAERRWGTRFTADTEGMHPGLAAWVNDYLGMRAFQSSDFGRACACFIHTFEHGLATGQLRRAIIAATNIGNGFTSLNDHHAALEWMQRGLDSARLTGWPNAVGSGLMQTAETLRHLGQLDAAQELLDEALQILAPMRGSRSYAIGLCYLGDLALDRHTYGAALETFVQLEARADALNQMDFKMMARRGQAHALSHLGRSADALAAAKASLALAREQDDAYRAIDALKVLAQIHAQHGLPLAGSSAPTPALHYLNEALDVAATIEGYTVPGDLLEAIAREYATAGDYPKAYETALAAGAAREKTHSDEATNRAVAMQVRHQTERARTEGEHHRELAAAEAERAEVLERTNAMLAHLGAIGQEITAHLDADAVFGALQRHVNGLLDAFTFQVYLLDESGQQLSRAYGIEAGKPLPPSSFPVTHPTAVSARCVRERREFLLNLEPEADSPNLIPGTAFTRTVLFAPMMVGERILGVMSVQALPPDAYGERERQIVRTLCAYGAIALDNARAYLQLEAAMRTLKDTQAELVDKNLELEDAYRTLEEASLTDPLTGLRNRRFLFQHLEADVAMCLRRHDEGVRFGNREGERPCDMDLVFFMVDLDRFKEINDHHGHAAGDLVLIQMRERLREVFRESDYLIRWGGEEFLIVARGTNRDDARLVAERVRDAVAGRDFTLAEERRLSATCSIGFACFPFFADHPRLLTWPQVVEVADQGLYMAKRAGRNTWVGLSGGAAGAPEGVFQRIIRDARVDGGTAEVLVEARSANS